MNNDLSFILLEIGGFNGIVIFNVLMAINFDFLIVNVSFVDLGVFVRVTRRLELIDCENFSENFWISFFAKIENRKKVCR